MDRISISEACELLRVSRPTLNMYRRKYHLSEVRLGGKIRLSRAELIKKIILPAGDVPKDLFLTFISDSQLSGLQPLVGVYDLRRIQGIDAYGVLALLCSIKAYLKESNENSVDLLVDGSPFCSYLDSIGFFIEVERAHAGRVSWDASAVKKMNMSRFAVILPLHLVGYRGAEKKLLDDIYDPLLRQGFSENYCALIGWIIGELCDNAHTHSEGPCYLIIEALESESTLTRLLCIAIGDIGIGIPQSLKKNENYTEISENILFAMAFLSEVSRMEVVPKRGKGLSDVLAISKGNSSWLRAESGSLGMKFDFRDGKNKIEYIKPLAQAPGTRFNLVLIDNEFKEFTRASINEIIQGFLETV